MSDNQESPSNKSISGNPDFKTPTLQTALDCCNRRNIKSEWMDL